MKDTQKESKNMMHSSDTAELRMEQQTKTEHQCCLETYFHFRAKTKNPN